MTQIRGYVPATRRPGELGIHSLDHFGLTVPDLAVAEDFYKSFGVDVEAESASLVLRTGSHTGAIIHEGDRKCLRYLSFGIFEDDLAGFQDRLGAYKIPRLDPPHGLDSKGLWFRDPDGNLVELKIAEKSSLSAKAPFAMSSVPAGSRGAPGRAERPLIHPKRLCHVLLFTPDVDRAIVFYQQILGMRLSDRGGDAIAFMHGIHGSDHHLLAFGLSSIPGFHHASWAVDDINAVGLGAMQMAEKGFDKGWGLLRHVLGSNFSHYVKDPWGSYFEYTCDIDFISANQDWCAGEHKPADSIYLWGPTLPEDFITNTEVVPTDS